MKLFVNLFLHSHCIYCEHSKLECIVKWFYYMVLESFLSDKYSDMVAVKTTHWNAIRPFTHSICQYKIWWMSNPLRHTLQYDSFNLEILLVRDLREIVPRLQSVWFMTGSFAINNWYSNFILCYLEFIETLALL
jgi:hypothetical protein